MAGNRQQSRFLSLVSNVDEYKNALAIAQNAEGAGELQTLKTLDSLESKLERLKVTIQEFYTSSGLEALYKNIVDIITNVVGAMNSLPKIGEKFPAAALSIGLGVIGNVKTILTLLVNSITKVFDEIQNKHKRMTENIVDQAGKGARDARNAVKGETEKPQTEPKQSLSNKEKWRVGTQVAGAALSATSAILNGIALNEYGSSTNTDQDRAAGRKMAAGTIAGLAGDVANVVTQFLSGNKLGAITTGITGVVKVISSGISAWQMLNPTLERTAELEEKRLQQLHEETVLAKGNVNDLQQAITKLKQLEKQQYSSNEAMEEYLDYRSQVAEQFPQLINGYDNEGNAVVDLAQDYLTLNDAILTALKAEAAEAKQKATTLESQRKAGEEAFKPTEKITAIGGKVKKEDVEQYENYFKSIGLKASYRPFLTTPQTDIQFDFSNPDAENLLFNAFKNGSIIRGEKQDEAWWEILKNIYPILSSNYNLDNLNPDIKGSIEALRQTEDVSLKIDLFLESIDILKQAQSDYYQAQIDSANLATERINAQVQLQEQMNQSYPEKASLLYLDKTLNGLIKDIINTAIVQDNNGKITYGNYDTANEFYEKLDEQTNEFLSYYVSLSDRQQKVISDIISNRKNYTTQDEYIQALRQVGITNDFFLQYLGKSWTNLSNEIQDNLDGAESQFKTRLKNIKRATQLSSKLSDLTTIQDFPLVLQSTLINSIDYIITQYENGLFDYGDKLTSAFESLYASMHEDRDFMTKYATTLASLDFFDAYAVEDFIKTLEEDSVDKIIIEYFKTYASALNKGILTITERAQTKTKDTQEKIDKMAKAVTTGLDSYDDLNEWIQGLQKIRDEMEKVGKAWTLGDVSLTNTNLFIRQDGKFYATATAYRLRYQRTLEDLQKEQQLYTEMLDIATRTSGYVNSLNTNATESSFKALITSLKGYNTDALVQYADSIWNLWQEVIDETEGLTSFTDEAGNTIDKDTYISQEFQKRYQALISSMQGVILQDQLELLTKDEILKTIRWEDLLEDRNNNQLKDSIKNALSAAGFTSEQITEFMTNLLIGGETGVKALEDIFKDSGIIITSEQRQKAYRAAIDPLVSIFDSIDSFFVGSYVSDDVANILKKYNFAKVNNNVIESIDLTSQEYVNFLQAIINNGQSTQEEITKATDAILKQGTAKYDFASDIIGGMDWSEIVNKIGEEQAKLFLGYFSVDETTGKVYAANATVYQEMLRALGIAGQQAINLTKEFNSKAIETTNTINSNIESELNTLSSAKTGDLIDLRQVYEVIEDTFGNTFESEEGQFGKTGVALITGSTYGFLKDVADALEAAEGVEDSQIRKLKDTMNSMLTNYVSFIAQGINGTLNNEDFANLWQNFGALGVDTENIQAFKTAQGIQFTQSSLISIYGQMRESNALLAQQLESDLIPQWTKSGEQCENIEGTLVHIVQLQRELTTTSEEKNKQLQNELSLTKAILAEQLKTPDSFNFMDRNLPTGMQNAVNWWNSGVKGYSAINAAKSSGYMDIEAYYNIITTMANLVEQSDSEIEYLGMTAGNAWSRAAELITAGMSSITAIDGEEAKISMAKLGEAISDGAFDMSKGYDEAIKEMARANIDMLDAQIKMLQGIVAMEDLGELINDGEPLELDNLFTYEDKELTGLTKGFTDAQEKFKALKKETKEYLKTIYLDFGDKGIFSIAELFEANESTWEKLGVDAAQQFIDFWNIALSKGWSTENIQAQLAGAGITNKDGLKFNREAVTQLMSLATTGETISTSFGDVAKAKIESLSTILDGALDRLATILSGNSNENGTSYLKPPAREWNPGDEKEAASTNTWPTLPNAEITKMRTELAKAQAIAKEAQAQVTELTIQLEQNSASSTVEINGLKADIAAAQASADEAWARVNELEQQLNVISSTRSTTTITTPNRGDSSALEDLQNEYEDALKTIKDLETIINDSSIQISTIIIEKERLDQECKTLNEKLSQALSTNQTNSELITSLEQELSIKNAELETKEAQIAALQEKLNTEIQLRTELEGSEQRLKEQLGNISNNDPKVADLTEQLHSVEIERDNLKFNNDQLNAAVDEAWNAYDEVNDALTAARAYISTLLKEKINAKSAEVILQADRQTADYGRKQRAIEEEQLRYATQQKIAQDSVNQMLAADARTAEYGREQQDLLSEQVYAAFLAERDNAYREAEEERRRWEEEQQTKNNSIAYDANIITETDQRVAEAQREAAEAMANVLANAQEHAEAREKYSSYKTSKEDLEELLKKYFDVLLEIETLSEAGDLHDDYYENGEMNEEEYKNIKNYIQSLLQSSYSELETLTADLDHYNISIEELQVQYGESTKAITIQQKALEFLEQTVKNFKNQTSSLNNKLISVSSNWSKAGVAASNAAKTAKDAYTTIVNEGLNRLENLAPLTSSSDKTKKVISGDTGAKGNALAAGRTLMGELGPELWVSNGHYYVAGQNGAEFVNLPSDAIVFNHKQTADLLKRGYATRGKPVTNESNAIARAQGQGPAKASARQTLATLVAIRAQWEALFNAGARDLGSLAGRGGGGGGGGKDWQPKTTTGDIQRWYNLLRQIAKIEEQITYQETLQSKLESDKVARGQELYDSYKKQMELLDAEIRRNNYLAEIQKSWYDMKREELARSDYGRIFTYDEEGLQQYVGNSMPGSGLGLDILENLNRRDIYGKAIENAATAEAQLRYLQSVGFNTDNLKYNEDGTVIDTSKLSGEELADAYVSMMENFWTTVDNWRDELDNLYDSYHEQQEKLIQNQSKQNELIQKMLDNQISLENKVLDAITDLRQKSIDELQDQRDAIDKAAQQYIDGLNDQLGKERDMYQNQQNADELLKLQRQLAILQRSGGSASQIRNLQNQIDSKMRDEYFDKQQEQIEAIQEASDKQLERLDHQIELMTETLAYQKENGLLWQDVYVVMQRSPSEIADFVAVNDKELQAKSALQWEEDTRKTLEEAQIYRAYAQEANEHTWKQTTDFSFEMEERLNELIDTTAKGNSDIVSAVVTGKSSGGGGGSGSSGGSSGGGTKTTNTQTTTNTTTSTKQVNPVIADVVKEKELLLKAIKQLNDRMVDDIKTIPDRNSFVGQITLDIMEGSYNELYQKYRKQLILATTIPDLNNIYNQFIKEYKNFGNRYSGVLKHFSSGGLVDFTGPAMVHGSKTRPESIFSAEDTAFLRNELLNNIKTLPSIVNGFKAILGNYANTNTYNSISGSSNIEHAEVNMYVQSIANDYDARRAGEQALDAIVRISRKNGPTSVSRR